MLGKENFWIIGAVAGGYISTLFGLCKVECFGLGSFIVTVIGAVVVLYIYKKSKSKVIEGAQPMLLLKTKDLTWSIMVLF